MDLLTFLLDAKMHGYASAGERDESQMEDGGKRLRYRFGKYLYQDIYYGSNPFIGEELVFKDGAAAWAMNYYGRVLDPSAPAGEVYRFLQEAMRLVKADRPFRGPESHRNGDWEYQDASQGDLNGFNGEEKIFFQNRLVYLLHYRGGKVG
jgi:hypothetical protein